MPHSVYVVQVIAKNDLEDIPNLTGKILSFAKRWCHAGMHAKRNIGFVLVTDESLHDLSRRLWPRLIDLQELGSIERFFIYPAPEEVVSDHGNIDSLNHWIRAGRVEAGKRNKSQNMGYRKRRQARIGGSINHL